MATIIPIGILGTVDLRNFKAVAASSALQAGRIVSQRLTFPTQRPHRDHPAVA
jgi:hypothetical protein